MKKPISFFLITLVSISVLAQKDTPKKDKSTFIEVTSGFYQEMLRDIKEYEKTLVKTKPKLHFKIDLTDVELPNNVDLYKSVWHNPPISQGNAGTCWAFSTISFYESEVFRLTGQKVKLSELYIVYWEYVEKARGFVRERGESHFDEGSEPNAVTRMMKLYGIVPADIYTGLKPGQPFHNHTKMVEEMKSYLKSVKERNAWNEDEVLETIKSIMNHYIGKPPTKVPYNGEQITPENYLKNVLKINPDDYVDILSLKEPGYWKKAEYDVPDNWWHCEDYYNVPLEVFMDALKNAIKNGYSCSIGGDVSEAGFDKRAQCAVVPTFDIPSRYIDEDARQFRFSNKSTTDDHGMHLVGYYEKNGSTWFLLKDSSSGSRNNEKNSKNFGYYFFSEDYVKLKMMIYTIHKDAVKDILKKFK